MFKLILNILLLVFFLCAAVNADVASDLKSKNDELSQIKRDINKKKFEKEKLQKKEKQFKKELERITSAISKTEKQLKKIEAEIKTAEKKLAVASDKYTTADNEKNSVNDVIQKQYLQYAKRNIFSYYSDSIELKMRESLMHDYSGRYADAKKREELAQKDIQKYNKAKKELLNLKTKQQNLVVKNKELQKEKNELLKTTEGKRMEAEKEIEALSESAKALTKLIEKLGEVSKKAEIGKRQKTTIRSASNTRKNNLPWPVEGTVILNYGKNKHPDLDTNIISNGIKIKTQNNAIIRSVESGKIAFVGEFRSYGKMVIIDHNGEFFSVYANLYEITVKEDKKIARGDEIAKVGDGDAAVLYFEVRQSNIPEDPKLWLKEK